MINEYVPFPLALAYCNACLYNNRALQGSFVSIHVLFFFLNSHFVSCIYFCTFSLSLWVTTLTESSEVINSLWKTDVENDGCTRANQRKSTILYKYIIVSMTDLYVCLLFNHSSAGLLLCSELCGSAGGNETRGSRNKHRPDYNWCGSQKNH